MLILTESRIRELVHVDPARVAIAEAFRALHDGDATIANVISLPFASPTGVAHIKAGHIHSDSVWTAKVSADFYPDQALTVHSGLMLVLSSVDGSLVSVLLDNGYLTELRTGAAGAVSAQLLAREDARELAIIGAGNQARYQLEALLRVRAIETVRIASRTHARAQLFAEEIIGVHGLHAEVCDSVQDAVDGADIVVTTTPSPQPLVEAAWLKPGVHVTAVGSDDPTKQELTAEVLARADVVAVDDRGQAARIGELHHAISSGLRSEGDAVTLGEVLAGAAPGRERAEDVTVADLTGVGVQDAAIASLVVREALKAENARLEQDSQQARLITTEGPARAGSV